MTSKTKKIMVISALSISIIASLIYIIFQLGITKDTFLKITNSNGNDYRLSFSPETDRFLNALDKKVNTDNYTENFTNRFGFQIATQNPDGPQGNGIVPPTQTDFEQMFSREIGKSISVPEVTEKEIRVAKIENTQSVIQYIQKLNTIILRANNTSAKEVKTISETNISDIAKTASALHTAATDLLALETPASWVEFHIKTINVYQKKAALLDALADVGNDPVKTLVAAKELQNLTQEEAQLSTLFLEKINQVKS